MQVPKPQHVPHLPITQGRLKLAHLPYDTRLGTVLFQELPRRRPAHRDSIVGRVEDLESQAALLDG